LEYKNFVHFYFLCFSIIDFSLKKKTKQNLFIREKQF